MIPRTIHLTQPAPSSLEATSVLLAFDSESLPRLVYWGRALIHGNADADYEAVAVAQRPQILGAGLDMAEMPSLLPGQDEAWSGTPFIQVRRSAGDLFVHFRVIDIRTTPSSCVITAQDPQAELSLNLHITIDPSGLILQQACLTNTSAEPLNVSRLWLNFTLPADCQDLLTHSGHHLRERSSQRQPFTEGLFAKESWMGRPDFNSTLLMAAGEKGFSFEKGTVRAIHVAWSGNSAHIAQRTPYTHGVLGGGELLYDGEIVLDKGHSYWTPILVGAWGNGMNEVAARFHSYIRSQHTTHETKPRPVTLNTWEAVYFDHDETRMRELAALAASLGVERFVVDDGWFHRRRDDRRGLGDWYPDDERWPDGLASLARYVHDCGMEFGLWFEPEMISLDSEAARAHPEWILRPHPQRLPLSGREQYVLDLSNPQAWTHVYRALEQMIHTCAIDYIKWDHNRFVTEAVSALNSRPSVHHQTLAVYRLLDCLREEFPLLEIESCASGGGRVDLGILTRTDRIWASDCTDPLERVDIQRHTSLLVPPEMIGAHIADSPSHITGRHTHITTRAVVAFEGHFGVEWDLLAAENSQRQAIGEWIGLYRQYRRNNWRVCHVDTSDEALRVDGLISPDCSHSLWRITYMATSAHYPYSLIRLPGLDAKGRYRLRPFGGTQPYRDFPTPAERSALNWWSDEGVVIPGSVISTWGFRPPHLLPGTAILIEALRVE